MFVESIKAALNAIRLLFKNRLTLPLLIVLYGALLFTGYLFVTTREATVSQLVVTLGLVVIAPALFFALQAVSVNYVSGSTGIGAIRKTAGDGLKLVVVTVPVIAFSALVFYGLGKIDSQPTVVTSLRYLVIGVIAPLLAIQLWVIASRNGLRQLLRRVPQAAARAFAPQSVFVYACGVLVFAIAPYFLIFHSSEIERAWLELLLLTIRLIASALLILFGWVATVGTLSLLNKH